MMRNIILVINETATNEKRLQTNSSLPRIETGAVNLYCCSKGLFDVGLVHSQKSRQRR